MQRPWLGSWAGLARIGVMVVAATVYLVFQTQRPKTRLAGQLAGLSTLAVLVVSASATEAALWLLVWSPYLILPFQGERVVQWERILLRVLLAGQVVLGLIAYFSHSGQFETPGFGIRASGLYGTPNALYPICVFAAMEFLQAAENSRKTVFGAVPLYGLVVSVFLLFLTFSRVGAIALVAGIATWATVAPRQRLAYLVGTVPVFLLGAIRRGLASPRIEWVDRSARGHGLTILAGLSAVIHGSILGGGAHSFVRTPQYRMLLERSPLAPWEPKCLPLHFAIEDGVLAAAVLSFWLVNPLLSWRDNRTNTAPHVSLALVAFLGAEVLTNSTSLPSTVAFLSVFAIHWREVGGKPDTAGSLEPGNLSGTSLAASVLQ